jgi:phage FluMu protein Com
MKIPVPKSPYPFSFNVDMVDPQTCVRMGGHLETLWEDRAATKGEIETWCPRCRLHWITDLKTEQDAEKFKKRKKRKG